MQPPQRSPFKGGAGEGVIVSQIGWDPAGTGDLLTLLPAGHAAGMYEVALVVVVRTAPGSGTPSATLTWNSPTFGAESKVMSATVNLSAATGTSFGNTSSANAMHRCAALMSTGSAAITLQLSSTGVAALVDIYASARLIAA